MLRFKIVSQKLQCAHKFLGDFVTKASSESVVEG